jgi:hypothetical protein
MIAAGGLLVGYIMCVFNPISSPAIKEIELFEDGVWWLNQAVSRASQEESKFPDKILCEALTFISNIFSCRLSLFQTLMIAQPQMALTKMVLHL